MGDNPEMPQSNFKCLIRGIEVHGHSKVEENIPNYIVQVQIFRDYF